MDLNYERDLYIDKSVLDEEATDQPVRFARWARLHAEAVAERDRAKRRVSVVRASVENEVRKDFETGRRVGKGTEAQIKAEVEVSALVMKAEEDLIEATRQMNVLAGGREAFQERKDELGDLVQLWRSMYWSDVKVPQQRPERSLSDMEEERQRKALGQSQRLAGRE